jgi:hypothetical protein
LLRAILSDWRHDTRIERIKLCTYEQLSRVSHFMKKFRKLGFIDYANGLTVHSGLLNVVLHD